MNDSSGGTGADDIKAKWPGVTFADEVPRRGYFKLTLAVPELRVNKGLFGLTKSTPQNADIKPEFTTSSIRFLVGITSGNNKVLYEYNKKLPEDIDPDKCEYKVKNNFVVVIVCKKESVSWTQYSQYLMRKEKQEDT